MITRRSFLGLIGAAASAAPIRALAQRTPEPRRIGYLSGGSRPASLDDGPWGAFRQGMRDIGYVEGRNLVIEWRFADGKYERLPDLVKELVQLKVEVIVASGTAAISAAQQVTSTVPIVMTGTSDPVGSGFVKTLARPGGNITGVSTLTVEVSPKYVELLLGMVPKLSYIAVLAKSNNPAHTAHVKNIQSAAKRAGVDTLALEAGTLPEIQSALAMAARSKAGAVIVLRDSYFTGQLARIAQLAAENRLPSISGNGEYVQAGGLMSYGPSINASARLAATYVDRILRGAKPAELPVEQPTKFEMLINGATAKKLGVTIPQSMLIQADKVIE